jgi:hypothetical protein
MHGIQEVGIIIIIANPLGGSCFSSHLWGAVHTCHPLAPGAPFLIG